MSLHFFPRTVPREGQGEAGQRCPWTDWEIGRKIPNDQSCSTYLLRIVYQPSITAKWTTPKLNDLTELLYCALFHGSRIWTGFTCGMTNLHATQYSLGQPTWDWRIQNGPTCLGPLCWLLAGVPSSPCGLFLQQDRLGFFICWLNLKGKVLMCKGLPCLSCATFDGISWPKQVTWSSSETAWEGLHRRQIHRGPCAKPRLYRWLMNSSLGQTVVMWIRYPCSSQQDSLNFPLLALTPLSPWLLTFQMMSFHSGLQQVT